MLGLRGDGWRRGCRRTRTYSEPGEQTEHHHPTIDVSKALHEAGHEVEALGYEGVPDSGPVLRHAEAVADAEAKLDAILSEFPAD